MGKEQTLYPLATELRKQVMASGKVNKGYEELIRQVKIPKPMKTLFRPPYAANTRTIAWVSGSS